MANFFDFVKSKQGSSPVNGAPADMGQPVPQQPVVSTNGQSYNGIGSPPVQPVDMAPMQPVAQPPVQPVDQQPTQPSQPQIQPHAGGPLTSNLTEQKRGDIDVMTHLTQRSNRVFLSANNKAKEMGNAFVDSEHVLHGLLSDGEIYKLLTDMKIQPQLIDQELQKTYKKEQSSTPPQISPRVKRIVDNSLIIARKMGFEFISPEHILVALYEEGEGVGARVLVKLGLKKEDLNKRVLGKKEGIEKDSKDGAKGKSTLEQFTIDLTAKAASGQLDPVVERSEVIERVIHILSRRTKNNPALVGEAGVGKTAVVEGLAQRIVTKQVPEPLLEKRILELDLMGILAGASHRGEFEQRMKDMVEEVKASQGKIILFIDEIHTIVGAGSSGEGSIDASNFLKPALARGEMQLIGATTLTEYRKYIEKDPALERRFQPVVVPEPTEEAAIKMLKSTRDKYEAFHRVKIPDDAVEAAVKLSKRYVGERFLPDKAVDLIDEAAAAVRLPLISLPEEIKSLEERVAQLKQESVEADKAGDKVKVSILKSKIDDISANLNDKKDEFNMKKGQTTSAVSIDIIKDVIARWTGIPVSKISGSETEKLAKLEDIMHERMIGQTVAVTAVAEAVRRGRAGLKSAKRPIGSFVFLGPTGVGKTELAKTLADVLFGTEDSMIRFDMTEYMEKHEVAKLLGAPPGYVGYEEGGKLTEAVRRKPYSVVLFDEVEKAHPDIFNILLQILDDGRLTDNKGHVISFKNTVVICTSNIGSLVIQDELLKNGKGEVEEPPMLSTYTFSPRGREIFTIGPKYFERDSQNQAGAMQTNMLLDYFAGQELDNTKQDEKVEKVKDFPTQGFETHAISAKGVEVLTKGNVVYARGATTDKTWFVSTLIDYFKDNTVKNALPDAPDEQLPTARLKTHAFTPDDFEIVTFKDRFWKRKDGTNDWETGYLKDYFANQTLDNTGKEKPKALPLTYWDIHTFSPTGREAIVVGDNIWSREKDQPWKQTTLKEYFGAEFPLEKEIEEKNKVEEETDRKKYDVVKDKVMVELRKFFRPELINRFDEVIIFEPLKFSHMMQIVKLQLKSVGQLLEEQDMGFTYTPAAIKEIVRSGFDPVYGARPLRRAIQKLVENPISSLIIEGKAKPGSIIMVDFDGESFIFNIESVQIINSPNVQLIPKNFSCQNCGNKFTTDTKPTATPVCRKCASSKLVEEAKAAEPNQPAIPQTEVLAGEPGPLGNGRPPEAEPPVTNGAASLPVETADSNLDVAPTPATT